VRGSVQWADADPWVVEPGSVRALLNNWLLKRRLRGKRVRFAEAERVLLARKAKAVGRKGLLELDTIVSLDTLMRWYRRLVAQKWNFTHERGPGRPGMMQQGFRRRLRLNECIDVAKRAAKAKCQPRVLSSVVRCCVFLNARNDAAPSLLRDRETTGVRVQDPSDAGEFRQDLFYRLHVIELAMPSLGEMREDIPSLMPWPDWLRVVDSERWQSRA